ncbi:hypothetical protein MSAN_01962600 [Mycena sanguinolenta]|uniref:Uncharacterized protein n=1 Tax=Mycena sanguinolenta TaxID=230812 RepID=A0A8H6XNR8_9AGAR|nr:hypothetical protein MSAN_01962600 [Mycena sanguinolenta]
MGSYVLYYTSTPARGAFSTSRFSVPVALDLISLLDTSPLSAVCPANALGKRPRLGASGTAHEHTFFVDDLEGPVNDPIPAFVHRVSEDRRRVYVQELRVEPPSPVKRMRHDALRTDDDPAPMPLPDLREFSINSERYQLGIFDNAEPPGLPSF